MPAPAALAQLLTSLPVAATPGMVAVGLDAPATAPIDFAALLSAQLGLDPGGPLPGAAADLPALPARAGEIELEAPLEEGPDPAPEPLAVLMSLATVAVPAEPASAPQEPPATVRPPPALVLSLPAPAGLPFKPDAAAMAAAAGNAPATIAAGAEMGEPVLSQGPVTVATGTDMAPLAEEGAAPLPQFERVADAQHMPAPSERALQSTRPVERAASPEGALRPGHTGFASDLGSRLTWMAAHGQHVAELRLDPPQLGPVEVRLSIIGEQASLTLLSPHASVREALQASLPRLQEMLTGAGVDLGSVHVGSHAPGGEAGTERRAAWDAAPAWAVPGGGVPGVESDLRVGRGLIDTYA